MLKDFWHLIVPPDSPPKWEDELPMTEDERNEIEEFHTNDDTIGIIIVADIIIGAMLLSNSTLQY